MSLEMPGASQSPAQLRGLIKFNIMDVHKIRHSNAIQRTVSWSHSILHWMQLDLFVTKQQTLWAKHAS